jgi:AcrR family transcriptional regulator
MAPRKYDQKLRAQTADETRRRILDAVLERFSAAPTERVSVDQVARMAGVARSTVYLVFGSRAGLFDAVARDLLERGGFDRVVRATESPDAREHLREGFYGTTHTFAAHRDAFRVLYSMASLDPDAVGGTIQRAEENRWGGMRRLAAQLEQQQLLREDVTPEAAAQFMFVLTSFDGFDLLYSGRGMSADEVAEAFIRSAERTLLRS